MHFRHFAVGLSACSILSHVAFSAPAQPGSSSQLNTASSLSLDLLKPFNNSVLNTANSASVNHPVNLTVHRVRWGIGGVLCLEIEVCDWKPDPATIREVLAAADVAAGKKSAAGLVEGTFTQKSKNRFNTLLFEIGPDDPSEQLTWGDVAEILGPKGLPKFYHVTQQWRSIFFEVWHITRGELGSGSVRRWWQLGLPDEVNGVAVGHGCSSVARIS